MINILMNQKRGLNRFSKLPDDGDPWALNNVLTPEQKKNTSKNTMPPTGTSLSRCENVRKMTKFKLRNNL